MLFLFSLCGLLWRIPGGMDTKSQGALAVAGYTGIMGVDRSQ